MGDGSIEEEVPFPSLIAKSDEALDEGDVIRAAREAAQRHIGFVWRAVAFLVVAAYAGADEVFPYVFPATVSGYYVVNGHRGARLPAVLTTVAIALDDVLAGQENLLGRAADVESETHN